MAIHLTTYRGGRILAKLLLKAEVEKVTNEKISMQEKLDHAYNQIKDMATKTVEATGGVKILGNNATE